jgi:TonB-dependent receptor
MNSNNKFNKTILAKSMSLLLGTVVMMPAISQEQPASADVEVINVSGIRSSLIRSMDIKREGTGVVDAISSEDIGKFPDTNLAEALQRISGVSIDRQNGEGSKVTVRGFGPDFNLVTLNGRQMPTSNINATSANDSRSYDFSNIAAEGVSGVQVYKTSMAVNPTGGIGSTINISTTKPLNNPGLNASFGVKGVHDTSSDSGSSLTPELSGLYSNTFDNDKFGIALSGSFQSRESGAAYAEIGNGWREQTGGVGDWGSIPQTPEHVNAPADGVVYAVPQNMIYGFSETKRERTNGQLTLQYRPIDNLTASLDYTYAKNDVDFNQNLASVWMNFGHLESIWTDPDSDGVAAPLYIKENNVGVDENGNLTYSDLVSQVEQSGSVAENKSIGINIAYQVNDNLALEFDYHSSSAESKPNTIYGNSNTIQMATNIRGTTAIDFRGDLPIVTVEYPNAFDPADFGGTTNSLSNVSGLVPDTIRTTGTSFRNSYAKSEIDQLQIKGSYTFDDGVLNSIDFGVSQITVDNRNAFANAERPTWGGVGSFDDIPDDVLAASISTISDRLDNISGDKTNMQNAFFDVDFVTFADLVGDLYGIPLNADGTPADSAWPCGTTICAPSRYTTDRRTEEKQASAYVQANMSFDLGSMPSDLSVGLRYEKTDVTSNTLLPDIESIAWVSANEFAINLGEDLFYEGKGDYNYVLPSLDFKTELTDELILRTSFSKSITRPGYGNLTAGGNLGGVRIDGATGNKGNPGLLPTESTNIDLSLEWYYETGSYVSVAYFKKDVDNFISSEQVTETPFDVSSPVQGSRFDEAVAALGGNINDSTAIRDYIIANNPGDPYIIPANDALGIQAQILGDPSDGLVNVVFSQPVNSGSKSADGIELTVQHLFGETGFGLFANYTFVNSDLEFDDGNRDRGQTPLTGLSDTANFVGFYENDVYQVRIAYNWRDSFFTGIWGDPYGPIYTDAYSQLDMSMSYQLNENLSLSFEGINLTDENTRTYGRHELMTRRVQQTGPRYMLGARYTF